MEKNKLINFYTSRLTKDGKKVVITLIEGEGENRKFYTAVVTLNCDKKINATIDDNGNVQIEMPLSKYEKHYNDENDDLPF